MQTGLRRYAGAGLLCLLSGCGMQWPGSVDKATVLPPARADLYDWKAEPAMVSNHGVYRQNEFVYQDYIHDDHGPNTDGISHLDIPFGLAGPTLAAPTDLRMSPAPTLNFAGDYAYGVTEMHMDDVADLIEFRVAADADHVYYRFTLADMSDAWPMVVGLCVNQDRRGDTGFGRWPFGAGLTDRLGCEQFYTVYSDPYLSGAYVTDAGGTSTHIGELGGTVEHDLHDATLEMRLPRTVADPGVATWRYTVGSGLWNGASQSWRAPLPVPAPVPLLPLPSGGRVGAPLIWDLLSNNGEPNSVWMEERQANDLIAQNVIDHHVDVDFARLAEERDDADPPLTGVIQRIYRSQHPFDPSIGRGRGKDVEISLGVHYLYRGPWQPYVAVIPDNYYEDPARDYPFDLCMHPLGANHNVEVYYSEAFSRPDYTPLTTGVVPATGNLGFNQVLALVNRLQAVYACTLGRGEGLGYQGGDGLVDVLEVEADMLQRYRVDGERRTVHGVSLGAVGTWHLSSLYPDRYAAAMPYIFTTDVTGGLTANPALANLYNLPVFFSIGTLDEFGQGPQGDPLADELERYGNEYVYLQYLGRQHEGRIENDFLPFVEALAYPRRRVRDPARVVYRFDPARFSDKVPGEGVAYWVSGMRQRDAAQPATVDAVSLARADELPRHQVIFDGISLNARKTYLGRFRGLLRLSEEEFRALWHPEIWEPGWQPLSLSVTPTQFEVEPVGNGLRLTATNLAEVRLDVARMKLGAGTVSYAINTDGPLEIVLSDGRRLQLPAAGAYEGSLPPASVAD